MKATQLTWLTLSLTLSAAIGCGGSATPTPTKAPATATAKPKPPLFTGPPLSYVPAAGLRWLVAIEPSRLHAEKKLMAKIAPLLPPDRLERYAKNSGVDLRTLKTGAVAGFDYATLYVAQTDDTEGPRKIFETRLHLGGKTRTPHPDLVSITGVSDKTPLTLVALDQHLIAVAVGDPRPALVVEGFARKKLKKSPPALEGVALKELPASVHEAPLRFYAPGPFEREWLAGARGLLAVTEAVAISVLPRPDGNLRLTLYMLGDWKAVGPDTTARLVDAWEDLSESSTGRLFGLDQLRAAPIVSAGDRVLKLTIDIELAPLVAGLHAAVSADVWEMLDLTPRDRSRGEIDHGGPLAPPSKDPKPGK